MISYKKLEPIYISAKFVGIYAFEILTWNVLQTCANCNFSDSGLIDFMSPTNSCGAIKCAPRPILQRKGRKLVENSLPLRDANSKLQNLLLD